MGTKRCIASAIVEERKACVRRWTDGFRFTMYGNRAKLTDRLGSCMMIERLNELAITYVTLGSRIYILSTWDKEMSRIYTESRFLLYSNAHLLRLVSSSFNNPAGRNGRSCNWISKVLPRHILRGVPVRSFSACSASQDLAMKTCIPCKSKDIQRVTEQTANELLKQVHDWKLLNEDGTMKLQRCWKVKSFTKGLEFFQLVADIAEAQGHHPDLHLVGWNNLKIEIWTHSVGGLTENDFILAAKINSLRVEHLLRNKTAAQAV